MDEVFLINSAVLGVGLAMDAFSVSAANGLHQPKMRRRTQCVIAGTFAGFQFLMPMIGWFCVHTIAAYFQVFQKFIPWIALLLLAGIGGKMLADGIRAGRKEGETVSRKLTAGVLLLQGVATSIDALSVGFTIAGYGGREALTASLIIAAVTFVICVGGVSVGRIFGTRLSGKASVLGGCILLFIGIEIFVKGVL